MKPTVYIETSVISYLTARTSKDICAAAWQNITADWWDNRRADFDYWGMSHRLSAPHLSFLRAKAMSNDPIIQETRQLRDSYAEEHGHDIDAIFQDILKRQKKSSKKFVRLPSRTPLNDIRAYDSAKHESGDEVIDFDQAIAEIEAGKAA